MSSREKGTIAQKNYFVTRLGKDNGKGTKFNWLGFGRSLRTVKKGQVPSEQNQQRQIQKFVAIYK